MKVTTLLMVCVLAAAGAAGKSDRVSATSENKIDVATENQTPSAEDSAVVNASQSEAAVQWRYLSAPTYVAPKVPI